MIYSIIAQLRFKKPTDIEGIIIIRGFYNRQPVAYRSLGHRIRRDQWNIVKKEVCNEHPNAQLLNMLINKTLNTIQADILQKQIMGATISKAHIITAVKGEAHGKSFLEFCRMKIKDDYKNEETQRALKTQVNKISGFDQDPTFSDINALWLTRYKKYMEEKLKNKANTIWSSLKFVNTMINKAIKQGGIIGESPFVNFDRGQCMPSGKEPLSVEEIKKIHKLVYDDGVELRLRATACRFMLMIYSGMRFSDAMRFDPVIHFPNGRLIMHYKKWDGRVNFLGSNNLREIVSMIPGFPLDICLNEFNDRLKIIAGICGISKHITTHIGRHTMGFILSEMNVPKEKAMKILGHKKDSSINIYYHVTDEQVDREIQKLNLL